LAHRRPARPPGVGGNPPLPLEVRVDAVAAVVLDGLSYRRAGRMVGISKTEAGESLDLLLGELAAVGVCQPDGTFVTSIDQLRERLGGGTARRRAGGGPSGRDFGPQYRRGGGAAGGEDRLRRGGVRGRARGPGATSRGVGQP